MNKLFLFEDKVGLKWVTWLNPTREADLMNSPVLGQSFDLNEARANFLKALETAINEDIIRVTRQYVDDLEHPMNEN